MSLGVIEGEAAGCGLEVSMVNRVRGYCMDRILESSSCVPPREAEMVNCLLRRSRWRDEVRPADAVVRIGSRVKSGV